MGPRPAWVPPPWSPAPKPDALSLVLCLLLLGCPHGALAVPSCMEDEFPAGDQCCPKCDPGYRVEQGCGASTDTACVPCTPGTYMDDLNGLDECLPCRDCDPYEGLVTRRMCSSTRNTVCGCDQGHFCVHEDGDGCAECKPHSVCSPGQGEKVTGTEWQDTVCEDCPPGTFSYGGALAECQPWNRCSGAFEVEASPGTSHLDVTCRSWKNEFYYNYLPLACMCILPPAVVLCFVPVRRRRARERLTRMSSQLQELCAELRRLKGTQDAEDATEGGKEEPRVSGQDQPADHWLQDADG